jgi:hypothetical protein
VAGRVENLKPWKPGESGNPGGRPRTKPITEELQRLLDQEAPKGDGATWAEVIALALLLKARTGDVRAIAELTSRIEGKPFQAVTVNVAADDDLADRMAAARKRAIEMKDNERKP